MSAPASGVAVLVAVTFGTGVAVYAVSRDLLVIVVWVAGAVLLYRAAKKVPGTPDHSPGRGSEGVAEEEPQVTAVRDHSHLNRWLVTKPSRWMSADTDKTGTS